MKIFISHSSKDNTIVKKIIEILDEYGIKYWVDHKELKTEGCSPWTEINDGLEASDHVAYKKVFWQMDRQKRTLHIRHIHLQKDMNNNKMERLNGEIRDREKVMRGLKRKDSSMLRGYQLYHNYFRPHGTKWHNSCPKMWNPHQWGQQMEDSNSKF